jgi:UDP-N-acetyl-D-galactosamine dehydrogenase
MILAGRKVNDGMAKFVAEKVMKLAAPESVAILGATYKPNVSDTRHAGAEKIAAELYEYGVPCDIYDPLVDKYTRPLLSNYDAIIYAQNHDEFSGGAFWENAAPGGLIVDLTGAVSRKLVESKGLKFWSL